MSDLSRAHSAARSAQREHFKTCPSGCTPTDSKCEEDQRLYTAEYRAWMAAHHEIVMLRTKMPGAAIPWDVSDERYRWVIDHVKACDTCAYISEDSWTVCNDARRHFAGPPAPVAEAAL